MTARITVVSPMDLAMEIVGEAFAEIWPEAQVVNLLDESLYADFAGGKPQTEETGRTMRRIAGRTG